MVKVDELANVVKGNNRDSNVYIKVGDTVYPINTIYEAPDGTYIKLIADTSRSRYEPEEIESNPKNMQGEKVCISLKTLYESGHKNLKSGGHIRYTEEDGTEYYDLCADTGTTDVLFLCDGEEVTILSKTEKSVLVEVSEAFVKNPETHYKIVFSAEEFNIAAFR